jgi:hypothetical protein
VNDYSLDELEGQALDFGLVEAALVDDHLIEQFVEVDVAVLKHEEDAFGLESHDYFPQTDDVGVVGQHLEYLHLAKGSNGEAVLVVQHLHLLYGQLLIRILIPSEEDDAVSALPDHLSLLVLADEPTVESVHQVLYSPS